MLVKIIMLFLAGMMILAMFGKLRRGGQGGAKPPGKVAFARKCTSCGRYRIGSSPCPCVEDRSPPP